MPLPSEDRKRHCDLQLLRQREQAEYDVSRITGVRPMASQPIRSADWISPWQCRYIQKTNGNFEGAMVQTQHQKLSALLILTDNWRGTEMRKRIIWYVLVLTFVCTGTLQICS